jgi:hypothetical protein
VQLSVGWVVGEVSEECGWTAVACVFPPSHRSSIAAVSLACTPVRGVNSSHRPLRRGDTTQVCRDDLRTDVTTGKHLLLTVLNGSSLTAKWANNPFLLALQKAARWLRFLARASARRLARRRRIQRSNETSHHISHPQAPTARLARERHCCSRVRE